MNQVVLIGRLTRDPELRFTPGSGKATASFTLAVNREYSKEDKADFIRIVTWGKTAENIAKYIGKGRLIAVKGSMQTRNYEDKNNVTRYITEVVADRVEFLDYSKKSTNNESDDEYDFNKFEVVDEDVPF